MGQRAIAPPTAYLNKFIFIISSSLKVLLISIIACNYENLRFHVYDTKSFHRSPTPPPPPSSPPLLVTFAPPLPLKITQVQMVVLGGRGGWGGGGEGALMHDVPGCSTTTPHSSAHHIYNPHICTTCTLTQHIHMHTHTYAQHTHPHMHNIHPHICTTCTTTHMHNMYICVYACCAYVWVHNMYTHTHTHMHMHNAEHDST